MSLPIVCVACSFGVICIGGCCVRDVSTQHVAVSYKEGVIHEGAGDVSAHHPSVATALIDNVFESDQCLTLRIQKTSPHWRTL